MHPIKQILLGELTMVLLGCGHLVASRPAISAPLTPSYKLPACALPTKPLTLYNKPNYRAYNHQPPLLGKELVLAATIVTLSAVAGYSLFKWYKQPLKKSLARCCLVLPTDIQNILLPFLTESPSKKLIQEREDETCETPQTPTVITGQPNDGDNKWLQWLIIFMKKTFQKINLW